MDTINTVDAAKPAYQPPYTHFVTWLAERGMTYEHWLGLPGPDADAYMRAWLASPHPVHGTIKNATRLTLLTEPDGDFVFRLIPTAPPAAAAPEPVACVETTEAIHVPIEYTDPDPGNVPIGLGWPRGDEGAIRSRVEKARMYGEGNVGGIPPCVVGGNRRPTTWDNRWTWLGLFFFGLVMGLLAWDWVN